MFKHSTVRQSVAGVAVADGFPSSGDKIQVTTKNITTGTGTVTITVRAGNDQAYKSIVDGTIDLAAPIGLIIEGKFTGVKATSSSSGDVFELEVTS